MTTIGKLSRKFKRAIGYSESMKVTSEDQSLLETIRKNVELDADATETQRLLELDDLRFCDPLTQWSDADRASREASGRPVLTEDRLGPFLAQVCNEQRKNRPGVQVNPVDDSGDIDTAEVIQGLIRHIEYNSNADTAYDTAFEWAVRVGRGFYRICTDYVADEGDEQEILIKRVPNPHMVFMDPATQESDYSDAKWGGFKVWLSEDDFKATYPDSQTASIGTDSWRSIGDDAEDWMSKDGSACLVVEYFYKVFEKVPGKKRETIKTTVKWVKCTAVEILERGEFPSKYIPIIPVLGKEVLQNGERTYAGLVRAGKDPQKRHNYLLTSQVERIAFMPLATWIGAKGFMGNRKHAWNNAHKSQIAALEFDVIGDEGQGINAPRLITEEAPIMAVTNAMQSAEMGFKAVLGMYDANIGNQQSSTSGVAISRLQNQGETGNYHFQDNLSRAQRLEGRIIVDMIPTIYDTERVVRIIGEDQTQQTVRINGQPKAADAGNVRAGIKAMFDLTTGKYDVTVNSGPSYQSKRQEDRALLMAMLQGPMGQQIAVGMPDLVASTLDSPIAKQMVERFKKMLPPALQEQPEGQPAIPPQVQQMVQGMQQQAQGMAQQHEQLVATVHQLKDQLDSKNAEMALEWQKAQLDSDTKKFIADLNAKAGLLEAEMKTGAPGAMGQVQAAIAEIQSQLEDVAGLTIHNHEALNAQPEPEPEPEEPQPSQLQQVLEGHRQALEGISKALTRMGGPKRIINDADGNPIGTEPVEEPAND